MTESAINPTELRRRERQWRVQEAACRLVIERGYDGFTMDDLAAEAGMSRRTLFNLGADKASCVLGDKDVEHHPAIDTFRQGGPTGRLLADLQTVVVTLIGSVEEDEPKALEHHRLIEQAIAADPKVHSLVNERFAEFIALAASAITDREGWAADDRRARVIATTLLGLIQLSLDELGHEGDERTLTEVFTQVCTTFLDCVELA